MTKLPTDLSGRDLIKALQRIGSDTSKFYINLGNTTEYKILWGRELTVGCPVVVSPLPREWS
jgi:hypothetical protein